MRSSLVFGWSCKGVAIATVAVAWKSGRFGAGRLPRPLLLTGEEAEKSSGSNRCPKTCSILCLTTQSNNKVQYKVLHKEIEKVTRIFGRFGCKLVSIVGKKWRDSVEKVTGAVQTRAFTVFNRQRGITKMIL